MVAEAFDPRTRHTVFLHQGYLHGRWTSVITKDMTIAGSLKLNKNAARVFSGGGDQQGLTGGGRAGESLPGLR